MSRIGRLSVRGVNPRALDSRELDLPAPRAPADAARALNVQALTARPAARPALGAQAPAARSPVVRSTIARAAIARALAAALLASAVAAAPAAPARAAPHASGVSSAHRGSDLIVQGVGPIDPGLAARVAPYTDTRGATFLAWLPDGSMLVRTRFASTAELHRVATPLGTREQLTYSSDPVLRAAAPLASGTVFAFLKDRGGDANDQVYLYRLTDRTVRLLTGAEARHGALVWSRDGKHLAFYGSERDPASDDIYVVDLTAGAGARPHLVVAGQQGTWLPLDWSPDDRTLLIEQSVSREASRLYLANVATGSITPVDTGKDTGAIRAARFAPGGHGIYYISDAGSEFAELRYLDPVTHDSRALTSNVPWDIDAFDVSADGRYVAYVANAGGASHLTLLDTRYKLELSPRGVPQGVITSLEFDHTGRQLAFTVESPQSPRDVYVLDLPSQKVVRWTDSEPGPLTREAFVPAKLIHFETWDRVGLHRRLLSAYLYRPRTPGPHPVLIDIHGGPGGEARPTFDPFIQMVVNELGYVVIAPNVRGSAGYGKHFLELANGRLRADAVRDIGALLVWIDLQHDLDSKRVVVLGKSYGGYLALAALDDYNDRLCGGIDFGGITNFVTFLQRAPAYRRGTLRAEFGDERNSDTRDFLDRISPIDRSKWIRRPLLVVDGLNDPRVPPSQTQDLVAVLQSRAADVWYLAARDEGTEFLEKSDRDAYYRIAAAFLASLEKPGEETLSDSR